MNKIRRDRIVDLVRVPANELIPHPKNWRIHGDEQRTALAQVMDRIGIIDAVVATRTPDGDLQIIDGHLRREMQGTELIPVLVVDLDEDEARVALATFDGIGAMADIDTDQLAEIFLEASTSDKGTDRDTAQVMSAVFEKTLAKALKKEDAVEESPDLGPPVAVDDEPVDIFALLVECADADDQTALFARLSGEGRTCRATTL